MDAVKFTALASTFVDEDALTIFMALIDGVADCAALTLTGTSSLPFVNSRPLELTTCCFPVCWDAVGSPAVAWLLRQAVIADVVVSGMNSSVDAFGWKESYDQGVHCHCRSWVGLAGGFWPDLSCAIVGRGSHWLRGLEHCGSGSMVWLVVGMAHEVESPGIGVEAATIVTCCRAQAGTRTDAGCTLVEALVDKRIA